MRVLIAGGGITGLAAAYHLQELRAQRGLDLEILLLEAGSRAGGLIETVEHEGCLLEGGPDSMITDKPWAAALARRLGLEGEIIGTNREHQRSFVVHEGKLTPIPEGFQVLAPSRLEPLLRAPLLSAAGKARLALEPLIPPHTSAADESLGSFVTRRLGREVLDRLAQPLVTGIYGGDPWELSLQATMPRFLEMERRYGSLLRGMRARNRQPARGRVTVRDETAQRALQQPDADQGVSGARYGLFVSFRRGMQTLTGALLQAIPPGVIRLRCRVACLRRVESEWEAVLENGESERADRVIAALPAHTAARLVRQERAPLADLLAGIPYSSAATITFAFRQDQIDHPLDGFGFVAPAREGLALLGCTFTHRKFAGRAPEGICLLRAFVGDAALRGRPAGLLQRLVCSDLQRLLGIRGDPLWVWERTLEASMPAYRVGHLDRVAALEREAERLPGLTLAGNAYRGVGLPDSIRSGEEAAERAAA